jgi:hypothetical protein
MNFEELIEQKYQQLECTGVVDIQVEPDTLSTELIDLEQNQDLSEAEREQRRIWLEANGVWLLAGYLRCPCCGQWHLAVTVHGLYPDDIEGDVGAWARARQELMTAYADACGQSPSN